MSAIEPRDIIEIFVHLPGHSITINKGKLFYHGLASLHLSSISIATHNVPFSCFFWRAIKKIKTVDKHNHKLHSSQGLFRNTRFLVDIWRWSVCLGNDDDDYDSDVGALAQNNIGVLFLPPCQGYCILEWIEINEITGNC